MIDKITEFLTNKIRKEMPEVDDERAEVINYGLQILLGEVPKFFIMLLIAYALGLLKLSFITFFIIMPYRMFSGGFHLHTHIGCIISTCTFYCGVAFLSKTIVLDSIAKYVLVAIITVFGIIMIKLYAPADTIKHPLINKNKRIVLKMLSITFCTLLVILSIIIKNETIDSLIIFGIYVEISLIIPITYKLFHLSYNNYKNYILKNNLS